MRMSDWSSDVCSSDLSARAGWRWRRTRSGRVRSWGIWAWDQPVDGPFPPTEANLPVGFEPLERDAYGPVDIVLRPFRAQADARAGGKKNQADADPGRPGHDYAPPPQGKRRAEGQRTGAT